VGGRDGRALPVSNLWLWREGFSHQGRHFETYDEFRELEIHWFII
jgi:hypothetical protein